MKIFYALLGVVMVVGGVWIWMAVRGGGGATEPVDLGDIDAAALTELAQPIEVGDPDASVTIMEFGDYQCPACRTFAMSVKPQVDLAWVETGQAKFRFYDFPLDHMHEHAFLAARAARCAGDQQRYFDYHDELFRTQAEWSGMGSPTGHFGQLADDLGLDGRAFSACLDSDRFADVVTASQLLGHRLGVPGTPAVFVHDGETLRPTAGFMFADVQQAMEAAGVVN